MPDPDRIGPDEEDRALLLGPADLPALGELLPDFPDSLTGYVELESEEATRQRLGHAYGSCGALVVRVHDGDTLTVRVPHWPPIIREVEVRLYGIDAPELHDPRPDIRALAEKARARLRILLPVEDKVRLLHLRRDKYFRVLAEVRAGAVDPVATLLEEGLARPYNGLGPKPW